MMKYLIPGFLRRKVPLVLQYEMVECGAASLSMILQYFGKYLPLSDLRYQCGVSRDGSNMLNLKKAAIHYGLSVKVGKQKPREILDGKVDFPCLAWWNYNHFVVFESADGKHLRIADPGGGKYKVNESVLTKSFSGLLLQFDKTDSFEKSGRPEREILNFLPIIGEYQISIYFLLLISTALLVTSLASPGLSGAFVQSFLGDKRYELGLPIMWLSFLMVILAASLTSVQLNVVRRLALTIQRKLSVEISFKILSVDFQFYTSRFIGDIASRLKLSENIANTLINQFLVFVLGLIGAFLIIPFLLLISWQLTVVSLIYIFVNIALAAISANILIDSNRSIQVESGKVNGITVRMLSDTRTIKASGLENRYLSTYQDFYTPILKKGQEVQSTMNSFAFLADLSNTLYDYGTIAFSGFLVMQGSMNLAGFMAFQVLRNEITGPLLGVSNLLEQLQQAEAELGRLQDLRLVENDPKVRSLNSYKSQLGESKLNSVSEEKQVSSNISKPSSISLTNVGQTFSPLSPNVLTNINLNIKTGELVSIIGPSGSGKSTLIKNIVGLYQPTEGQILYGNHDWMDYDDETIRQSLAYVSQETNIFRGTIYDNLTMYNEGYDLEQVRKVARIACFDDVVMSMPQGYSHYLGDNGNGLSGGQLQRLSITRALLRSPHILFLDEATSALDVPTERMVIQNIKQLNLTVIAVAHRLLTAKLSDQVIVLDKGAIRESGHPDELLQQDDSLFKKLVEEED